MRCKVCNTMLNDYETSFKYPGTNEYADECMNCYSDSMNDLNELMPVDDHEETDE